MFNSLNIFEIRKDAISALKEDSNFIVFILIYYVLPFLLSFVVYGLGYKLDSNLSGHLISGVSIFSGLMFSLLFVITNNLASRKTQYAGREDEEIKRYLDNYSKFSNKAVSIISYSIVKSILIVVIIVVANMYSEHLGETVNSKLRWVWLFLSMFVYQYLIMILAILKEMYAMLYEDINRKL